MLSKAKLGSLCRSLAWDKAQLSTSHLNQMQENGVSISPSKSSPALFEWDHVEDIEPA